MFRKDDSKRQEQRLRDEEERRLRVRILELEEKEGEDIRQVVNDFFVDVLQYKDGVPHGVKIVGRDQKQTNNKGKNAKTRHVILECENDAVKNDLLRAENTNAALQNNIKITRDLTKEERQQLMQNTTAQKPVQKEQSRRAEKQVQKELKNLPEQPEQPEPKNQGERIRRERKWFLCLKGAPEFYEDDEVEHAIDFFLYKVLGLVKDVDLEEDAITSVKREGKFECGFWRPIKIELKDKKAWDDLMSFKKKKMDRLTGTTYFLNPY